MRARFWKMEDGKQTQKRRKGEFNHLLKRPSQQGFLLCPKEESWREVEAAAYTSETEERME